MSKAKYSFKESEVTRALRAAMKAGATVTVEIDPPNHVIRLVPAKPDAANATTDLDKWLEEHREGSAQGD